MGEIFGRPFDLLLGRKTYDIFASHWPYVTDPNNPIARTFNAVTKYVASRSRPKLNWQNSQLLGADIVASLKQLKSENGPDLLVQGSSELVQTLWKNGLVDEFSVLIFPVVLGTGKRLFGDGAIPAGLKLLKSKSYPTGVIVANYAAERGRARAQAQSDLSGASIAQSILNRACTAPAHPIDRHAPRGRGLTS
jgi:dihydrofolate reductase